MGQRAEQQNRALRELAIVHQLVTTRLNRALRPLGLTVTHTSLLSYLAAAPAGGSVTEIAAVMEVNQPAVSKTLRALVERGAVSVDTHAADARRRTARLTPAGHHLLGQARKAMNPEVTLAFARLPDECLNELVRLLGQVREHLAETRPDLGERSLPELS
jgi:DNA-binding MarR family transcriptional regulator